LSQYKIEASLFLFAVVYIWKQAINHHELQNRASRWLVLNTLFDEFISSYLWVLLCFTIRGLLLFAGLQVPLAFAYLCPPVFGIYQSKYGLVPSLPLQWAEVRLGKIRFEKFLLAIIGHLGGYTCGYLLLQAVLPLPYKNIWMNGPNFPSGVKLGRLVLSELALTFTFTFTFFILSPVLKRKNKGFVVLLIIIPQMIIGKKFSGPVLNPLLAVLSLYFGTSYRAYLQNPFWWLVFVVAPFIGAFLAAFIINRVSF